MEDWLPFRYFPDTDSPTACCTLAYLVPEAPDLVYIASRIRHWMTECEVRHPHCPRTNAADVPLPSRVLMIQKKGPQTVVGLKDGVEQSGRYIALSYV